MDANASRDRLIALSLLPFLTPARIRLLLEYFDPLERVCRASCDLLQSLLSLTPEQAEEVRDPLTNMNRSRIAALRSQVVTLEDEAYPPLLREIVDPPLVLHYRGDPSLLNRLSIAVVGSRKASPYGTNAASHLASGLAAAGLVIVSGLARGIDTAAHEAALQCGGATVAVLGTGIDVVYPRSNGRLFERMAAQGLIITEFPPGAPPKAEHFPMRNRVISGLARGTLIVEATTRSGSLITARMAAEQGRDVFAVPGSIFSTGSEGAHRLVQYGAKLVHDANDVLEELPGGLRLAQNRDEEPGAPLREILRALSLEEGRHIESVATHLQRTPASVAQSLLELELAGWIRALPGARYVRIR